MSLDSATSPSAQFGQHNKDLQPARYRCGQCGRKFDRKDSLSRHNQIHDQERNQLKSRRKACSQCWKSKSKCSNESPSCSSCLKRNLQCVYEKHRKPTRTSTRSGMLGQTTSKSMSDTVDVNDSNTGAVGGILSPTSARETHTTDEFPNVFPEQDFFAVFEDQTLDLNNTNLDWIFELNDDDWALQPPENTQASQLTDAAPAQVEQLPGLDTIAQDAREPGNHAHRVEHGWAHGELPTPEPHNVPSPEDPWSADVNAGPAQRLVLPSLGEADIPGLAQKHFLMRLLSPQVWAALKRCIEMPSEQSLWQAADVDAFPNKEVIDHCIDLYFAHVHQMSPIIHRPTFDPSENLIVTLAVVSLGAPYSNFKGCQAFAISLSELNRRLILFMAEQNRRFVRTEQYLIAQLIQGLYGYLSGDERLFELSESCRSSLVHHAKCMGLLQGHVPQPRAGDTLEDQWHQWIRQERLRRLGWAVYEYDICIALLHNSQPYLNIEDTSLALPCSMEHWDAESAYAWASLRSWNGTIPITQQLGPLVKVLVEDGEDPEDKITNERHRLIIIMSLGRMLWSLKEIRHSSMVSLVRDNLESVRERISHVLEQLKRFPIPLSQTQTRREVARAVHQTQLIHITLLYSAGDLMDLFFTFLRKVLLRKTAEGASAKARLLQWAAEDPRRVREVAYNSAQILALTRQFPENLTLEPFHVFHGGVLLMIMARLMPPVPHEHYQPTALHIDHLGTPGDPTYSKISQWVQKGGQSIVGVHGVPVLCCKTGWRQALDETAELLSRIKVWGIAQSLLRVVLKIRDRSLDVDWCE